MEQAAAVLVGRWERVGSVRRYGVVGGGGLGVHGGQAASQRTGALHLHALWQRHLVFDRFLLVDSGSGRRRRSPWIRRHVFGWRRGESVQMSAGVGRRR